MNEEIFSNIYLLLETKWVFIQRKEFSNEVLKMEKENEINSGEKKRESVFSFETEFLKETKKNKIKTKMNE